MKRKDLLLALLVVIVWGANFTVIKLGLSGIPSMILVALRFTLTVLPAIFFVKRPKTEWKYIIMYGATVGIAQFSLLFYAMEIGMPASLSSIVLQLQAFISPILGFIILKENLKPKQIIGFVIAATGLFFIGTATEVNGISSIPITALILTILAATFWAISNIIARIASGKAQEKGEKLDMFGLVVWSALIPPIPLFGMALLMDTPQIIGNALANINGISIFAVLYLAYGATLFGYGIWGGLITKYPLSKVAPLSLLVPITGLLTARIVLLEQLSKMQWIGVSVIIFGLLVTNLDVKQLVKRKKEEVYTDHVREDQ